MRQHGDDGGRQRPGLADSHWTAARRGRARRPCVKWPDPICQDELYPLVERDLGGGSADGRAIALALARAGIDVTICGRRDTELAKVAGESDCIFDIAADVTLDGGSRARGLRHRRRQCRNGRQHASSAQDHAR